MTDEEKLFKELKRLMMQKPKNTPSNTYHIRYELWKESIFYAVLHSFETEKTK